MTKINLLSIFQRQSLGFYKLFDEMELGSRQIHKFHWSEAFQHPLCDFTKRWELANSQIIMNVFIGAVLLNCYVIQMNESTS